jgi:hypothetical protein
VDIKPVNSVEEALNATREMLTDLGRIIPTQYLNAKAIANVLVKQTQDRFDSVTATLTNDITKVNSDFTFGVGDFREAPTNELHSLAEKLHYEPNTKDYHRSVVATLIAGSVASRIVVSFHSVGSGFRGLVVVVAYFQTDNGPAIPVSEDMFRISYEEPQAEIEKRYARWLDQCLIQGIALWRRTLV